MPSSPSERITFDSVPEADVDRWDREWVNYLNTESMASHVIEARHMHPVGNVVGKSPEEVFNTVMTFHPALTYAPVLRVWAPGEAIDSAKVLEVGCGTGLLSKQLGRVVTEYLGVDVSRLALAIARGGAYWHCHFLHMNDHDDLRRLAHRYDVMLCREFFIHHHFESAVNVLRFARTMLRPGGRIYADFFMAGDAAAQMIENGAVVRSARAGRDPTFASCGYDYTEQDVVDAAEEAGLIIVEQTPRQDHLRRFVTFETPPAPPPEPAAEPEAEAAEPELEADASDDSARVQARGEPEPAESA